MELKNYNNLKEELVSILIDVHTQRAAKDLYLLYNTETQEGEIETIYPSSVMIATDGYMAVYMWTSFEKSNADFFDECDTIEDIANILGADDLDAFKKDIAEEIECEAEDVSYTDAKKYVLDDEDLFALYMENYEQFLRDAYGAEFDMTAIRLLDEAMEKVSAEIEE